MDNLIGADPLSQEEMDLQSLASEKLDAGEELNSDLSSMVEGPTQLGEEGWQGEAATEPDPFFAYAREMGLDPEDPKSRDEYNRQNELRAAEDRLEGSEIYPTDMSSRADMNMRREGYDFKSRPHDQDFYNEPRMRLGKNRPSQPPVPQGQVQSGPISLGSAMEEYQGMDPKAALRKKVASQNTPPMPRTAFQNVIRSLPGMSDYGEREEQQDRRQDSPQGNPTGSYSRGRNK
tara:strand:+ start:684 stop:1382 length:699 start_codon:yes stop_codon:yes gene_type:complete